jgi:hypothetical protein
VETKELTQSIRQVEAWTPTDVMAQVRAIQELMAQGMQQDEHYGIIPGTNSKKPSLLKAGAEKLCLMFRLAPRFEITEKHLENGHKDIQVVCTLTHINTGAFWGQGVASCSTMESKYRYRSGAGVSTGIQVPKQYWDLRRAGKGPESLELIGGKGYTTVKGEDGLWYIAEKIEKVENPDIADVYNTVLKIAKKRALVDATITATAASDIFTQDLEELTPPEPAKKKEEVKIPEVVENALEPLITGEEQLTLIKLVKDKNVSQEAFRAHLKQKYGIAGWSKIKKKDYSDVYQWVILNEADAVNG